MLLYPSCLKTLSQFSLNADKRNMLEEMTGQLREEVSRCSLYICSKNLVFVVCTYHLREEVNWCSVYLWSNCFVFGGVYLLYEGGGD